MNRNLTMMTDLYELTMMYGYLSEGMEQRRAVFDMFFRGQKGQEGYALMAGVEQLVDYIQSLHFSKEDIGYLRSLKLFSEDFLHRLEHFAFTGNIWAVSEGTVVYPNVPLVKVEAPLFEAQLVETALLNLIGHPMLIATKAHRIARAAEGDKVMEFGLRRAQGPDAGTWGARAAVIGGCAATSNVLTGMLFDIPVAGTHAHSWVMSFQDELTAFRAYAHAFPDNCLLLVDTYDTLHSGVPNAIRVFKELRDKGHEPVGIRLDSGDLAYLSIQARNMLDEAGFPHAIICASNDLDEYLIRELKMQGAQISLWGVGTRLITAADMVSLGSVYKLGALADEKGAMQPKMKVSDNPAKITLPGDKEVWRLYDESGMAVADYITLSGEEVDQSQPLTIFDPNQTWKKMTLETFTARKLQQPLFVNGRFVGQRKTLKEITAYREQDEKTFWEQYFRLQNPQKYKVDLSDKLWQLRRDMLESAGK